MQKRFFLILVLLCLGVFLTACAQPKAFEITNVSKIELRSGNNGATIKIVDADTIQQITDNITSLTYHKKKSSIGYGGWSYWLKWYDESGILLEEMTIQSNEVINYKNYFYAVSGGSIHTARFDELLN